MIVQDLVWLVNGATCRFVTIVCIRHSRLCVTNSFPYRPGERNLPRASIHP